MRFYLRYQGSRTGKQNEHHERLNKAEYVYNGWAVIVDSVDTYTKK
jgi:hypothetical protein